MYTSHVMPDSRVVASAANARGYVSEATRACETRESEIFWHKGESVCRSAFVPDLKHLERVRSLLAPVASTDDSAARALLDSRYDNPHPDSADLARIKALLPYRRLARDDFKSGKGVYPFPVYVASYADGSTARYSFWTRAGKAIDFAAGFNVALILGRGVPTAGYVESGGAQIPDPHFGGAVDTRPTRARRPSVVDYRRKLNEIAHLLAAGEIEAAKQVCAA